MSLSLEKHPKAGLRSESEEACLSDMWNGMQEMQAKAVGECRRSNEMNPPRVGGCEVESQEPRKQANAGDHDRNQKWRRSRVPKTHTLSRVKSEFDKRLKSR